MASDNGDHDFKEDEVDVAIRSHRRSEVPADLLDRCLATFPAANEVLLTPAKSTSRILVRWVTAASVVISVAGAYVAYDHQARLKSRRASELAQATNPHSQVTSAMNQSTTSNETERSAIVDQQKNYSELLERYSKAREQAFRNDAATQERLSVRDGNVEWQVPIVAFRTGGFDKTTKEKDVELLRQQLATARHERAFLKAQLDSVQSFTGMNGANGTLAQRAAELEARESELRQMLPYSEQSNSESYETVVDNPFMPVSKSPLSTFSTDVDTASYANVRRFLNQGTLPPRDSVRIEELVNYFTYSYPQPQGADPFSVNLEVAGCPWNAEHRLVRIGLKGREIAVEQRPPANLVFLVDVSGSMQPANKLPLLKTAMKMLLQRLGESERVAIVTYSHELRLVLPSTTCDSKETIIQALDSLQAAGSTNGAGGIQLAYQIAVENFIRRGVNRVILATDGDFNVGITDRDELSRFIEEKARSGVFLSVLGFGMGNLKDATLERLADKGNGHYAYIDTIDEARKVLVQELSGTLVTIAKDVKLQVEFNPQMVSAYRLIGYENRVMAAQDFNDDRKDAGEIGAGHTVTALYEIVPAGTSAGLSGIDPLKYQPDAKSREADRPDVEQGRIGDARRELLTVKLRYKQPEGSQSKLMEVALTDSGRRYSEATGDFRFAAAVAAFGMILRDSPYRGTATLAGVLELAEESRGTDREGYRTEFIKLARLAQTLQRE